jgi:hypothetical protein
MMRWKVKSWRLLTAAAVFAGALGAPQAARAEDFGENAGWGVLAVLSNIGYMPAKFVYATFGGLTGAFAYAVTLGDYEVSRNIWNASLGGTYVLTPSMMRGEDPIVFVGMPEVPGEVAEKSVASTPPPPTPFEDRPISDSGY